MYYIESIVGCVLFGNKTDEKVLTLNNVVVFFYMRRVDAVREARTFLPRGAQGMVHFSRDQTELSGNPTVAVVSGRANLYAGQKHTSLCDT